MKVYGASVVKGMLYTLKTFFETYIEDFKRMGGKQSEHVNHGLRSFEEGIVTVQYPEEPMPIGSTYERFRVLPMLVYDQLAPGETSEAPASTRAAQEFSDKNIRCTACGICAKVCPPQCIWIVQESDDKGKPITVPKDFFIDTAVCMNCGMCAEFCPFDAIKMDHKFALNVTEQRRDNYLYDLNKLLVPAEYHAEIHPKANAEEEAARKAEAEAKAAKEAAKKEAAAKKAAEAKAAPVAAPADAAPAADSADAAGGEDREARIAAAKARAAEAKAKREAAKAAGGEAAEAPAEKAEDPDREARIAAAKARAAEAKAKREANRAAEAAGDSVTAEPIAEVVAESAAPADDREARIAAAKARAAEAKAKREANRAAEAAGEQVLETAEPVETVTPAPVIDAPAAEAPAEDREARMAAAKARAAEAKAKREAAKAAEAAGIAVTPLVEAAETAQVETQSADKEVDPEREARIAAAKARAAEAKAKREAEKATAEVVAPASEIVPEDLVLETLVPEMAPEMGPENVPLNDQTVETVKSVTGVDKQGQTTTKESDTMSEQNQAKASIQSGAEESEAIANNDPVFTDAAPAGEIGQQPDIQPSQGQAVESPPPSSESNLTPDTTTAGDEKAAQPSEPAPTSGTAAEENVPLPAAGLEAAVGGEHAAASAQSAAKAEELEQADEDHDQAKASEST